MLPLLAEWADEVHAVLADLGYEGERPALTTPIKHRPGGGLTDDERTVNLLHAATRAPAERGNSLLKTTFKGAPPARRACGLDVDSGGTGAVNRGEDERSGRPAVGG